MSWVRQDLSTAGPAFRHSMTTVRSRAQSLSRPRASPATQRGNLPKGATAQELNEFNVAEHSRCNLSVVVFQELRFALDQGTPYSVFDSTRPGMIPDRFIYFMNKACCFLSR
jgi:hypothetical protein